MGVGDTGVGGTVVGNVEIGVLTTAVGREGAGVSDTAVVGGFTATSVGVEMVAGVAVDDGGVGIESQANSKMTRRKRLNGSRLHERELRDVSA